ncbi:Drug resistance transporter, EmrB/QacA subfamily [Acidipropionibacterium acidipropionici ATCC 4875]|uniref:Drug resistance transporter, EmrB/QacA subfamily n=1 Tax=Acidipropionibacterium acidipropionici (strain ATCC 4875 / DSM 20272 / JCM 6432 / NBRC 12425 / NCIMB 8070 / 4) TaxID=1171373 RepID=K7S0J6_ACIA4|nr:MFS transporter [Acidipropionibacterium acidipropionici]AFV90833.1 Drug resistance transporter, EmrB/QacA subfamily [Acidipropionibacterium acidipropionici ATCC 4875]ALN15031.1 MFS transporter [Acidipropionibacterium acidipropionici]
MPASSDQSSSGRMPDVRPSEGRLSNRRRTSILITCCLSIFIAMVDSTGVNLALPSISREMGASTSQLQWVIDAYLLVLASLMLLSGSMADRLGRRRIFSLGLLLFGLGSALCSVATGPAMLIATRALQAIGGSMLNPVAMAIITNTYPDARRRARAIGVWGAVVGIGMATGPLLGGLLGILVMATLSFAIITGGEQGFDHIQVLASAAIGALALAAFILVERHTAEPLLDLRYFRSVPFSAATVVAVLLFMAFSGFMFVATLYLQDDLGKSPLHAGLLTMPIALGNALLAPVSGRIVGRRGPGPSMVAGAVALAVGGVMLTLLGPSTPLWYFVLAGFFVGGANGVTNSAITSTAVSGMPAARSGVAASIASTGRQVGQSLGVAILGASLNTGLTSHAAFTDAARPGWFMIIGLALAIGALGVISGSSRARDSEARMTGTFS